MAAMIMLIPAKTYAGDIQSSMIEMSDHLGIDENNGSADRDEEASKTFKFAVGE